MIRLKRINHKGYVETIYKHEELKIVQSYLDLVIKKNTLSFSSFKEVTFVDGCKGLSVTKHNGNIIQYKIEA